jgi:hypothetical protein
VKYPNLGYALFIRDLTQRKLALSVQISESRFSRCGRGIGDFSSDERARIARVLLCDEAWLFARPKPQLSKNLQDTPAVSA